jgi:hypothetical protein
MPKMSFTKDGHEYQVEMTMEEFALFTAGKNGHSPSSESSAPTVRARRAGRPPKSSDQSKSTDPEKAAREAELIHRFTAFYDELSDRARNCLNTIRLHPKGIDSHDLAKSLGFKGPEQLGGLFGPGVRMIAKKHGIKVKNVYFSEVTFNDKVRKRTFYPRRLLLISQGK